MPIVGSNFGFGIFRAKCGVTKGVDSECKDYNSRDTTENFTQ